MLSCCALPCCCVSSTPTFLSVSLALWRLGRQIPSSSLLICQRVNKLRTSCIDFNDFQALEMKPSEPGPGFTLIGQQTWVSSWQRMYRKLVEGPPKAASVYYLTSFWYACLCVAGCNIVFMQACMCSSIQKAWPLGLNSKGFEHKNQVLPPYHGTCPPSLLPCLFIHAGM